MGIKYLFAKAESGYPIVQSVLEESELFKRISFTVEQ